MIYQSTIWNKPMFFVGYIEARGQLRDVIGQLHHYLVSVFFFFKYVQPQKADNQSF